MFITRLISGIILVALALLFICTGGDVLLAVMLVLSLIGMFELYRIFKVEKSLPGILGYLACITYYLDLRFQFCQDVMVIVLAFLILLLAVFVFSYPKFHSHQIMAAFFGLFYVGVMLSFLYQTRMLTNGQFIVWLIFLCSWGCDTSAYCVGVLFGKHKMSPILSPKKSIEGAVGGVVGAMLFTAIYCYVISAVFKMDDFAILPLVIISGVGALISMVGDLAASAIKRNFEIKDYGKLIPGHGGVLDRFDSVIITAPIIFFLAYYFYV
ncbi:MULTISPECIES: phosphatidate cytidylyltransferase [unclassified Pseudobutyrivibrio]|jgi:phosphatidate cytidylyltransferase|uniref:phosphatidate cytidylyltransferase n=1 Tax=unclassified Pseudobutyrivibrio TaxID=2638619 RepID=UPI0005D20D89|nr:MULTISPECIES: phosphatidate cytidylyltransferase [unclassified Pseudobutyrivibrio]SES73299.1 phosphatidate cytidylyltransferase [Pseudobutyrivibrio sp. C4]SFO31705.1 phosphatidate cytidylyltransferase [Pseudobutyrivibrio sp. JW11]